MPVVSCSGWSNDAITWGNPIRYADSVQTNTNRNRISSLLTLDPRFEGVRIQCVRLHDRAIRRRGSPGSCKLDSDLRRTPTATGFRVYSLWTPDSRECGYSAFVCTIGLSGDGVLRVQANSTPVA